MKFPFTFLILLFCLGMSAQETARFNNVYGIKYVCPAADEGVEIVPTAFKMETDSSSKFQMVFLRERRELNADFNYFLDGIYFQSEVKEWRGLHVWEIRHNDQEVFQSMDVNVSYDLTDGGIYFVTHLHRWGYGSGQDCWQARTVAFTAEGRGWQELAVHNIPEGTAYMVFNAAGQQICRGTIGADQCGIVRYTNDKVYLPEFDYWLP